MLCIFKLIDLIIRTHLFSSHPFNYNRLKRIHVSLYTLIDLTLNFPMLAPDDRNFTILNRILRPRELIVKPYRPLNTPD